MLWRNEHEQIRFIHAMKIGKQFFLTVLIRRGGAPSGAAVFIIFEGMGVSTPISNSKSGQFLWEII